jgi:RNA polymerase-binding transcription factor DksA
MNSTPSTTPGTPPSSSSRPAAGDPWSWHRRTLLALSARLNREANAHRREANELLGEARDDHDGRVADDNEIETLLAEARGELRLLDEIESALIRLTNGTYGRCEETGALIPAERLRALPWTRFTREAAERRERRTATE